MTNSRRTSWLAATLIMMLGAGSLPCLAENRIDEGRYDRAKRRVVLTVAELPACNAARKGTYYSVDDGASATDCSTGSGSTYVVCECDGSSWVAIGSIGGGGTETNVQVNTGGNLASADFQDGDIDWTEAAGVVTATVGCTDCVTLGTETTGNYVATVADAGSSRITVSGSGSEGAAVTLDVAEANLDHGSLGGLTDDDHTRYLDTSANDTFSATNWTITADTSAASDTKAVLLNGGGAASSARGAFLWLYGENHAATPGDAYLGSSLAGDLHISSQDDIFVGIGSGQLMVIQGGDLVFTGSGAGAFGSTSDAADNEVHVFASGGAAAVGRGAYLSIEGNEASGDGFLYSGDASGAVLQLQASPTDDTGIVRLTTIHSGNDPVAELRASDRTFNLTNASLEFTPDGDTFAIHAETSDGADNDQVLLIGGGGTSSDASRGAYLLLSGNQHATNTGGVQLFSGADGAADISITTGAIGSLIELQNEDGATDQLFTVDGGGAWFDGAAADTFELLSGVALLMEGSTSGAITFEVPATVTSHTLTWPSAQGGASTVLQNDGAGNLSWASSGATDHGALTGLTDDDHALYLNTTADDTYSETTWLVSANTSDASDTSYMAILGGGGSTLNLNRGAFVLVSGNEQATYGGGIQIQAGNPAGADIDIKTNDSTGAATLTLEHADSGGNQSLVIDGGGFTLNGGAATDTLELLGGIGFVMEGSTSGTITHEVPATVTTHTLTWPSAQGGASTVLTNNGSGTLSWSTPSGGSVPPETLDFGAASFYCAESANCATTTKDDNTNVDSLVLAFDDTTDQCVNQTFFVPSAVSTTGSDTVTFGVYWNAQTGSCTATVCEVLWDFRWVANATAEDFDDAYTTESSAASTASGTTTVGTLTTWTETITNLGWVANDFVHFQLCRDANGTGDDLPGNAQVQGAFVRIPQE